MKDEEKRRELKLNSHELRLDHYRKMAGLEDEKYNKANVNDTEMSYDFLHDQANYRPLPQRYWSYYLPTRILNSNYNPYPNLLKPFYAKQSDFEKSVNYRRFAFRCVAALALLKLGYEIGNWDSVSEDLEKNCVIEMETEEQIFDLLFNKDYTAVFIQLYVPGHSMKENWNHEFEKASSKY